MFDQFELEAEPFEFESTSDEMFESSAAESADEEWSEEAWRMRAARPIRSQRPLPRVLRPPRRPQKPIGRLPRRRWPIGYGSIVAIAPDSAPPSSEYTRWVQSTLNQVLGLQLPIDGVMGIETRSAIRSFQTQQGLPADGIVGPSTEAALIAASQAQPPQAQDTIPEFETLDFEADTSDWEGEVNRKSRDYIKWVQRSLNRIMGLNLAVDGISGTQTRSAVRSFQQQRGLLIDGIVGAQTERALITEGAGNPPGAGSLPSTPSQPSSGAALSASWVLPPDVRAAGERQLVRYDRPPSWDNGRNCTGSLTAGAAELRDYIRGAFRGISSIGGYNCRQNTANLAETSVHGTGRALDIMIPLVNRRANSAVGDPIANWLVQNAGAIGVQYIIWNRTRWSGSRSGRKDGEYGGPSPHMDHIHVELNRDGAARSTPWFLSRRQGTGSRETWAEEVNDESFYAPDELHNWERRGSQSELMFEPPIAELAMEFEEEIDPETPEHVEWLQRSLNQIRGLRLPEDGVLGPATRSALRNFQSQQGLDTSGILNSLTERSLMTAGATPHRHPERHFEAELESEVKRKSRDYIKWVQQALNRIMGLQLAVDGISGTQTRSAIRSFQQKHGLAIDGIVGAQTERALIAAGAASPPGSGSTPTPSVPTPSPYAFRPLPVETPGGGRIQDKRAPAAADLVTVSGVGGKQVQLHRLAADAWRAMVSAARSAGISDPLLLPTSGYRSPEYQKQLWDKALARYGSPEEARKWVAPPGGSAHQSGRAIDLYLGGKNDSRNVNSLRTLAAYKWLAADAGRFGFYPYGAEPWHWEYNPPA